MMSLIQGMIQEGEIRKALREAYFIAAVSQEIEQDQRSRIGSRSVESITPVEALQLYIESKKFPGERARILMEYGKRLIQQCSQT